MQEAHDLVIRLIAEYLRTNNLALAAMMRVCKRFYGLRDIFIGQLCISSRPYTKKPPPYGWNKVYSLWIGSNFEVYFPYSALSSLNTLLCSYQNFPNLIDLSPFSRLKTLHLRNCGNLIDISPLAQLHSVSLFYCDNLRDISALSSVHTLNIEQCYSVRDYSALGHVNVLILDHCHIDNLRCLNTVHDLSLINCFVPNQDFSPLGIGTIHRLKLKHYIDEEQYQGISSLGTIQYLTISCNYLRNEDIVGLGNVHTLKLTTYRYLNDISPLTGVHDLTLEDCTWVQDFSALCQTHTLTLSNLGNLSDVSPFRQSHNVTIMDSQKIIDVAPLSEVHTLAFINCHGIRDMTPLSRVQSLTLDNCSRIVDISPLVSVPHLKIERCVNIKRI